MMFASLNLIKDATTGEMRSRNKEETEEVAFRHKSLMQVSRHACALPPVGACSRRCLLPSVLAPVNPANQPWDCLPRLSRCSNINFQPSALNPKT